MICPHDNKECWSSGCFFQNGINKICCMKTQQPTFAYGGTIPAYGNEKTAEQVIAELREENRQLKEELRSFKKLRPM